MSKPIKIAVYGDTHVSSKNYGAHRDYAAESLSYYKAVVDIAESEAVDYMCCLGDLTQGRLTTLEYRAAFEKELMRAYNLTQGKHYCLRGNHDIATYGMTERDYYIGRGLLQEPENLFFNGLSLYMCNYGEEDSLVIEPKPNTTTVLLTHNYLRFSDTVLPPYGEPIELDNYTNWYGADLILNGHIHRSSKFSGHIIKDSLAKRTTVMNVGCPCRMSYESDMQPNGNVILLTVTYEGLQLGQRKFELLPIDEAFNLADREAKENLKRLKRGELGLIADTLDNRERFVGDPIAMINAMRVAQIYKDKAIALLQEN